MTRPTSSTRLALVATLIGGCLACAGDLAEPSAPRVLTAVSAGAQALPSVVSCPTDDPAVEAWVTFGQGTLTLWPDGAYEWRQAVGHSYRVTIDGHIQQGAWGGESTSAGTYVVGPDDALRLTGTTPTPPALPVTTGRVTRDAAELHVDIPCPAQVTTASPRRLTVTLR